MTENLKTKNYSQSVRNLLANIADEKIISIQVSRNPLPSIYTLFLNVITLGDFQKRLKQSSYDNLFHLFMQIRTSSGTYVLEKNEVIILKRLARLAPKTETIDIGSTNETVGSLLQKTLDRIGDSQFFFYQALTTNCQRFITDILKTNGLSTAENAKFIMQKTENLFNNDSRYRKLLNTVTDIASIKNTVVDKIKNTGNRLLKTVSKPSFQFRRPSRGNSKILM